MKMRMWKWSVISDEISQDISQAAAFAAAYGLQGLEIRSAFGRDLFQLTDADVRAIRECAGDAGLSISAVAPPFFKCDLEDEAAIRAHLHGLCRAVEIARQLGTDVIRGFGFWRRGAGEIPYGRIAEHFQAVTPILEDGGVRMGLENDPSVHTANGASLAALIRAIDHPRVGAVWDPGNVIFDEGGEVPFPDGYGAVRGKIFHIHLKDARRLDGRPAAVAFGAGEVDYQGQFSALLRDGFGGWVSLETHYRLARALDERELRLPAGYDFSEGGAQAGADFLENMANWLESWGMGTLYALPGQG